MSAPDKHLSGQVLEALAAGDTAEMPGLDVSAHLQSCARCRETLEAMKMENALFAGELNRSGMDVQARTAAASGVSRATLRVHRPFVYYAVAALLMLAVAVKLVWKDAPPASNNGVAVKFGDKQNVETKDDKNNPKSEKGKGGEAVFEGKTAVQWVDALIAMFEENPEVKPDAFYEAEGPIIEALTELGPVSLRELLRRGDEKHRALVLGRAGRLAGRLIESDLSAEAQQDMFAQAEGMLGHKDFAWRRVGVQFVSMIAKRYDAYLEKAKATLTKALNDSDRAVVRVARFELDFLPDPKETEQRRRADAATLLLTKAGELEAAADFDGAQKQLIEYLKLMPNDPKVIARLEQVKMAKADLEKSLVGRKVADLVKEGARLARMGKSEEATALGEQALKLSPGDIDAIRLLTEIAQEKSGQISRVDIGARTSAQSAQSNDAAAKRLLAAAEEYANQNKTAEAIALVREAMLLAPENAEIKLKGVRIVDLAGSVAIAKAAENPKPPKRTVGPGELDPFEDGKHATVKTPDKPVSKGSVGEVFDENPTPGAPISVDFTKIVLKDAVGDIAKKAGVKITIGAGVQGEITLKLDKTPWDVVLRNVAGKVGASATIDVKAGTARLSKGGRAAGEVDVFDQ